MLWWNEQMAPNAAGAIREEGHPRLEDIPSEGQAEELKESSNPSDSSAPAARLPEDQDTPYFS